MVIVKPASLPRTEIKTAAFLHTGSAPAGALDNLAAGIIDDAPIDLDFVLGLFYRETASSDKWHRQPYTAASKVVFLGPEPGYGALERIISSFPLPLLDAFGLGNFPALPQRALCSKILQSDGFKHFEIRQFRQFSNNHLSQALTHVRLPRGDRTGLGFRHANGRQDRVGGLALHSTHRQGYHHRRQS